MKWTAKQIEEIMKYMRENLDTETIFMFDIDRDRIGFFDSNGFGHVKDFSNIYKEMLDKRAEM